MMFVDAFAIVVILTREPEADAPADVLESVQSPITSPIAILEAALGICRKRYASVEEAEEDIGDFSRALRDQRLCRVKGREVSIAAGVFANPDGEDSSRADKALVGFVQMLLRFRRHRSMPSRRISRISEA
jgi:hypothetical protein